MRELILDTITIKNAPVEGKVAIAATTGYAGLELRGNDIKEYTARGGDLGRLKSLIEEHGLRVPAFVPESEYYGWHHSYDSALKDLLDDLFALCTRLGMSMLIFPVMSTEGDLPTTIENFKRLCDSASDHDLKICLEFIGHIPKVNDVRTAWEVVVDAGKENGGILVDLFHYYRGGSRLEDLKAVPTEKLFLIHLDDAMNLPVQQLVGAKHRLYPGEGVIPLGEILTVLRDKQYRGDYVVELFNEEYWSQDPREVAARSLQTSLAVFNGLDSN